MKSVVLPSTNQIAIEKIDTPMFTLGSTAGLVRDYNEDRIGYLEDGSRLRFVVTDGHWGDAAAVKVAKHLLKADLHFPATAQEAIDCTQEMEDDLYALLGKPHMDPNQDFTSEAAFVACELQDNTLHVTSYGDCRLLIIRNTHIVYELPSRETWLGAFSHLGLRARDSSGAGTVFQSLVVQPGDYILAYSDGIDQCIYEKETITSEQLARMTHASSPAAIFTTIMEQVYAEGAEDNASLIVAQINHKTTSVGEQSAS